MKKNNLRKGIALILSAFCFVYLFLKNPDLFMLGMGISLYTAYLFAERD